MTALRLVLVSPPGLAAFQLAPMLGEVVDKARSFGAHLEELHPQGFVALFGLEPLEHAPSRAVHAAWAAQNEPRGSRSCKRSWPGSRTR